MPSPLVTVVCLCYNHANYLREAVESVLNQTYKNIQIIIVDDASTDGSVIEIERLVKHYPSIELLLLKQNVGNCKAFNSALGLVKGDFVIDFATDDVLQPNRIESGVNEFARYDFTYGVNFADGELIDASGKHLGYHSDRFPSSEIPQGEIYKYVISRYFINSPSLMSRKSVFEELHGYDESLAYEDFDFLIRASRKFKFCYTPKVLVKKRILASSMSAGQFRKGSLQLLSTFRVCEKISRLNQNNKEGWALRHRILYEIRKALQLGEFELILRYLKLLTKA